MLLGAAVLGLACQALQLPGGMDGEPQWGPHLSGLTWLTTVACLLLLALAPLADDVLLTRLVIVGQMVVLGADLASASRFMLDLWQEHVSNTCERQDAQVPAAYCLVHFYLACAYTLVDVVFILCAVAAVFLETPSKLQHGMWRSLAVFFWIEFLLNISFAIVTVTMLAAWDGPLWFLPGSVLGISVAQFPSLRRALQNRVRRSVDGRGATAAAAGIASLMGSCDPKEALGYAASTFRIAPIHLITEEDLADNTPNPALIHCTQCARLGRCDAFVSHSWHDDAALKWSALQSWRGEFVRSTGQEPTVWVDKWCIDQRNIQEDLRCLPIFLSGCRYLVVLCGTTYLSRLWCIIELFTFVQMGGKAEQIIFVPLSRAGHMEEDLQAIRQSVQGFDSRLCECVDSNDKEKMMVIIHTAFGSLEAFNVAVRAVLDQAFLMRCDDLEAQLGSFNLCERDDAAQ